VVGKWSKVLSVREQFRSFLDEQQRNIGKIRGLEQKYQWASWGGPADVAELLALSRGNLLRTNHISLELMSVVQPEAVARIGMGKTTYYEVSQGWATQRAGAGLRGAIEDLERWKVPVEEGVRRACSVMALHAREPVDPIRWSRRLGLLNHVALIDRWLVQLDEDGGLDGTELRNLASLIREYHVGAVAATTSHVRQGVPSSIELGFLKPVEKDRRAGRARSEGKGVLHGDA
jgi:hypothetical protein